VEVQRVELEREVELAKLVRAKLEVEVEVEREAKLELNARLVQARWKFQHAQAKLQAQIMGGQLGEFEGAHMIARTAPPRSLDLSVVASVGQL
jgi:hypothetical protein